MIALGANIQVQQKKEAGIASGAAINGLSVKASKAVLGNDVGDATAPAALLDDREIVAAAFGVQFVDAVAFTLKALIDAGKFSVIDNTGRSAEMNPGSMAIFDTATNFPELDFIVTNIANIIVLANNNGTFQINSLGSNGMLEIDAATSAARFLATLHTGGDITSATDVKAINFVGSGGVSTADPGGGPGVPWMLGNVKAAASVLDGTQYLEVNVGGTIFKLALIV